MDVYLQGGSQRGASWLSRTSDLFLAAVVIATIALMILPLPNVVLDTLVATNIVVGVMLVLMGIYINTAVQFSAFPSVLLISTLFRLSLSVATTRMILLKGDAGSIIDTFGELVAGGNVVVGLVVFLIITLVQFLVIAKGAERVAEVGARFTLDAMPGKQMSIDSDLRSGLIDKIEARAKRRELELESKLHGSMDGAMKFVKGDAIAGIVIIIINLLGGLAIGVFQLDMSAGDAMSKYSILTIGDGLVAQIPALLGAMSAGLIVTRVTDGTADKHLGDSIQKQMTSIPRVLLVAGAMCLLFALVPGFPASVFIGLGFMLGLAGAMLVPAMRSRINRVSQPTFDTVLQRKESPDSDIVKTHSLGAQQAVPILLELPIECADRSQDEVFQSTLDGMLQELQQRSGLSFPVIQFHWHRMDTQEWRLYIYEVPVVQDTISDGNPANQVAARCAEALRKHATLFFGIQETSVLLSSASVDSPDIVKEALRAIPMQNIATILRKLVEEEVPIRNLRGILEALVQASQHEKDVDNLVEYSRIALARQISHRYAPDGVLRIVGLDAKLEESLLQMVRNNATSQQLAIDPSAVELVQKLLIDAVQEHQPDAIVVPVALRRHMRALIAEQCFDTPVLSHSELTGNLELEVLERVSLDASQQTGTNTPS